MLDEGHYSQGAGPQWKVGGARFPNLYKALLVGPNSWVLREGPGTRSTMWYERGREKKGSPWQLIWHVESKFSYPVIDIYG